jgi:hypothetical protein
MGVSEPLLSRTSSCAVGKRYAAQIRPMTVVMLPCLIITVVCCVWASACGQEAALAPISSSAHLPLRSADRRLPTGQRSAQELRGCGDLALPQAIAVG